MGVEGLWAWLKKKKVPTTAVRLGQTILSTSETSSSPETQPADSTEGTSAVSTTEDSAPSLETAGTDDTQAVSTEDNSRIRVDLLGGFYPTIVWAYRNRPLQEAHDHLTREVLKLGARESLVVYVDGNRPMEKAATHAKRDAISTTSISKAEAIIDQMESRLACDKNITKSRLQAATKALNTSFKWDREARDSFVAHLRHQQVEVVLCPTEADLKIAQDCGPHDIVVTRDSDLLAYASVHSVWRLIGRGRVLVYNLQDILETVRLSREQFMALCVVSKTDYGTNMQGLAAEMNSKIIRELTAEVGSPEPLTIDHSYNNLHRRFEGVKDMIRKRREQLWATKNGRTSAIPTWIRRHQRGKTYNRFRTIDRPPPISREGQDKASAPPLLHNARYAFTRRQQRLDHEAPATMIQYKAKPHIEAMETDDAVPKKKRANPGLKRPLNSLRKIDVMRALDYEHPIRCPPCGSLQGCVNHVLQDAPALRQKVVSCIRSATHQAWTLKLIVQEIIARYIDRIFTGTTHVSDEDQRLLDALCARCTPDESDENVESQDDNTPQRVFLVMFATFVVTGTRPKKRKQNPKMSQADNVNDFVTRLHELEILPLAQDTMRALPADALSLSASTLSNLIASQIKAEIDRHYRYGSNALHKQLTKDKENGLIPASVVVDVDENMPAIVNFGRLNQCSRNPWKQSPMSSIEQGFLSFSELNLLELFWNDADLKPRVQDLTRQFYASPPVSPSLLDAQEAIPLGRVIKEFLVDISPSGMTSRKKGKAGIRSAVKLLSYSEIQAHVNALRQKDFDPAIYATKGYLPRGSIRTDGHQLRLTLYKLRELESVKYKRYPGARYPCRLTSTVHGLNDHLKEVRHVFQSPEKDVDELLHCSPDKVKILALDMGQACTVGACLLLPEDERSATEEFITQAVKSKAVYQPIFKYRRWANNEKTKQIESAGERTTIQDIESSFPPLRGQSPRVSDYIQHRHRHRAALETQYNGTNFRWKKHGWDAARAKHEEYQRVADQLLKVLGGNIGSRRDPNNHCVIAIGLSKFQTQMGLASLDGTFSSYFIQLF
ncbi:Rad2 nuclease [Actinomortierella ambigua]|nr:Rad2 nuclease [Actinomortierella ambigua]